MRSFAWRIDGVLILFIIARLPETNLRRNYEIYSWIGELDNEEAALHVPCRTSISDSIFASPRWRLTFILDIRLRENRNGKEIEATGLFAVS